ncbi:ESCRT-II complex subunit-domain-containing protein [Cokeromyces recurvatus]|uniref:ESCRT-II complex subunit-domain-containing protein n=1 Tax=Cokeromyces recurvatus TaxID=90255 RepID=UPI00221F6665|nr:ESCRT-II complex subunit-domain-containing protein [Cokeromyces recurvatus]KAI7907496.1 ESCRT-II complex subunit-domain-containing protein [Cokeromyces recurvatus]
MGSTAFEYPKIFDFPPFFTRQITDATWKSQVSQWEALILQYTRQKHIFRLNLHQATTPGEIEIFENKKINRRLSFETLKDIIEEMVKNGNAEWEGGSKGQKNEVLIYWHTPEEWANLIWNWINETGQNNQIMTFYEITNGELAEGQEFFELDKTILNKALHILVKRDNAQIFKGTDEDSMGIKFFGP